MTRRLFVAPSALRRQGRAREWLLARDPSEEVLILAPSLDAARELMRQAALERGAAFGWRRALLPRLAASLSAAASGRAPVPAGSLVAEAMVARVAQRLLEEKQLRRFAEAASGPGFPRAAASVLGELRLAGASPRDVGVLDPELEALLDRFTEEIEAAGLADRAALYLAATKAARDATIRHPWLDLPTLLLDLPVANRAEAALLEAVLARAPEAFATVPQGDDGTLARLTPFCDLEREAPRGAASSLESLQRHLFEDSTPAGAQSDEEVTVISAPGESREAVEIARRALAFAREGVPFDRMAILLRSPEAYRAHLQEALHRAGIPAHFARGTVRPHPAGRAFLALLATAAEGLRAKRFAEYLSLGEVPRAVKGAPPEPVPAMDRWIPPEEESLPESVETQAEASVPEDPNTIVRAPRRWEMLLVESAVIGGLDRWERRLEGLASQRRLELAALDDPDDPIAVKIQRNLEDLASLRAFALPLLSALEPMRTRKALWSEWIQDLASLATRALQRPDRVLASLHALHPMGSVGPVGLDEVRVVLSRRLLETAVPPSKARYGRIFVGPTEAARGLAFDIVFVPGMAERLFPRKIVEEPFLLDAARLALDQELDRNADRVRSERLALRIAAGAASKRLVLSYPRVEIELSRPRVPSFYALEALRAAEGRLPDFDELASRAEKSVLARMGWPAPARPEDAIDEAEHDLAILKQLLGSAEGAGAASYLLRANPHLRRALRVRPRRWLNRWTFADGLVDTSDAAREAMRNHHLGSRSFSPTALQNFAACPYRFFLYSVHRLEPREMPERIDEIDPLSRGSMVHEVLFELFVALQDKGLLPVRLENRAEAMEILERVLTEVAERYRDDLHPAVDRVWESGVASVRADLREWLYKASEDDSGFVPWRFELSFGLREAREKDAHSVKDPVLLDSGIRLRGSIDLIEKKGDVLRVTDHKTGKERMKKDEIVSGGQILQPVLYALATEKLVPEARVESGRLYYCTWAGGFEERTVPLDRAAREGAETLAQVVGAALEEPFLPAAPAKDACFWCDYRPVCGPHEEARTARKPKDRLKKLASLRELP